MEGTAENNSGPGRGAPTQDMAKAEEMDLRGYTGDNRAQCLVFLLWQEDQLNGKIVEYVDLCKKVRRKVWDDKEK